MNPKKLIKSGFKYLFDSDYRFGINSNLGKYSKMDDRSYLCRKYAVEMKKELDLENPRTFNEKLQWLKLYNRKSEYTVLADKYLVRDYIEEKLGKEYLIPLLGEWDDPEKIDFNALPDKFVLKCNHNSGLGMCICTDKEKLDIKKVRKELKAGLAEDYFTYGREWVYKNIPRKIICEQYMVDESGYELKDYKFFCFDGKVRALYVAKDRNRKNEETKFDFFDENYNHLPITNGHPNSEPPYAIPDNFEQMKKIAEKLAQGIPHVRVDLYNVNGKIYFGEMTFYHLRGFTPFEPEEWDLTFGNWLTLPEKNTETER